MGLVRDGGSLHHPTCPDVDATLTEAHPVSDLIDARLHTCAQLPEGTLETALELVMARDRARRQLSRDASAPWGLLSAELMAARDAQVRFLHPLPPVLDDPVASVRPLLDSASTHLESVLNSPQRRQRALDAVSAPDAPDHLLGVSGTPPRAVSEVLTPFSLERVPAKIVAHVPARLARWALDGTWQAHCRTAAVPAEDAVDVLETAASLWVPDPEALHASLLAALDVARAV